MTLARLARYVARLFLDPSQPARSTPFHIGDLVACSLGDQWEILSVDAEAQDLVIRCLVVGDLVDPIWPGKIVNQPWDRCRLLRRAPMPPV